MWDCPECGCQAIAPGLDFCPQCYTPKNEPAGTPEASSAPEAGPASPQAPQDGWGIPDAED